MGLRSFLDDVAPHFEKGGKYAWAFPAYEAIDTALYTPGRVTGGPSHVRDGLDLKRIMITVWMCAFIPVFAGSYVVGLQANEAMQAMGLASVDNWRGPFLDYLTSYDPTSIWDCVLHGLAYFVPLYVTVFVAGIAFEIWFASVRGHEVNEGFFVTSILFTLTLPATLDGRRRDHLRGGDRQGGIWGHGQEFPESRADGTSFPLLRIPRTDVR